MQPRFTVYSTSLILDIQFMVNWHLSKQGIYWPVSPLTKFLAQTRLTYGNDIIVLTLLHLIEYTGKKAAKQFNVEDMFEKAKRTAKEISSSRMKGIIVLRYSLYRDYHMVLWLSTGITSHTVHLQTNKYVSISQIEQ